MQTRSSDKNSVCPSVTRVNCDKTVERSVQIYIPYERTYSLVFWEEWLVGDDPFYLKFWVNRQGRRQGFQSGGLQERPQSSPSPPSKTGNGEPSINTRLPSIAWFFVFGSRGIKTYWYSWGAARNNHMKFLLKFHATKVILVRYQTSVVSPG